jgi:hypothetical protein
VGHEVFFPEWRIAFGPQFRRSLAILLHLAMLATDEAGAAREPREPQTSACRLRFIREAPLRCNELVLSATEMTKHCE